MAQRALGASIESVCRPDLAFRFAHCARTTEPSEADFQFLNLLIHKARSTPKKGLKFVSLDRDSLHAVEFAGVTFATNQDLSSQLGFVTIMVGKNKRANILHYHGAKARCFTQS